MQVCEVCKENYETKSKRQKYCSPKCRMKSFIKRNPLKFSEYNRKCRLKKDILCVYCNNPIPIDKRKMGRTLCSDSCRIDSLNKSHKKSKETRRDLFLAHKESIGCLYCGYNKYGGSLDYHHIDSNNKDSRIKASDFKSKNSRYLNEISKCILLCKNCHYELHAKLLEKLKLENNKEIQNGEVFN